MNNNNQSVAVELLRSAIRLRTVENFIFEKIKSKAFNIPIYLSAGQEYCACAVAYFFRDLKKDERSIFIQHRNHHTYLAFGGSLESLFYELLGLIKGDANGMRGSASLHSAENNIFGHDGLMGSQAPIAVGYAFASKTLTICYAGDAAAEEDYYLAALGWAATKKLPILFVVEDNDLSILTKVKVRRCWRISEVAKSFGLNSFDIDDHPLSILNALNSIKQFPALLNIRTHRKYWHAGAGIDDPNIFDRHEKVCKEFPSEVITKIESEYLNEVERVWKKCNDS